MFQKVLFVFAPLFLRLTQNCSWSPSLPSCYKRILQAEARFTSAMQFGLSQPLFWFLQMTKHSADLIYCCLNSGVWEQLKTPIQIQSHGGIFTVCIRQGQKAYQYPITLKLKKPHRLCVRGGGGGRRGEIRSLLLCGLAG